MLTIVQRTPATADVLRKNPLGLYVEAVDWSREIEPAAPSVPPIAASVSTPPSSEPSQPQKEVQP